MILKIAFQTFYVIGCITWISLLSNTDEENKNILRFAGGFCFLISSTIALFIMR